MEHKHSLHYVKNISGRTVTGVFSVFGNLDSYNDRMWPGSFTKTFMERGHRVLHLWQHDIQAPSIARITNLREIGRSDLPDDVLRDFPDATGGAEVTREYLKTPRANEVFENIQAGIPLQMSFAFDALKFDFEESPDARGAWDQARNVREVRLWEVSDVNFGANEATTASKADLRVLAHQLFALLRQLKAGARHSERDITLLNEIHAAAVDLGCTTCKGIETGESTTQTDDASAKQRAARHALTLRARAITATMNIRSAKHE